MQSDLELRCPPFQNPPRTVQNYSIQHSNKKSEKIRIGISCESSTEQIIRMKCQALFLEEIIKFKISPTVGVTGTLMKEVIVVHIFHEFLPINFIIIVKTYYCTRFKMGMG